MDARAERNDEWSTFVSPDALLPAQFFGPLRRQPSCQGERRLMVAILEDALSCFQRYLRARHRRERQLFWDAEAWLLSDDQSPFSFEHICGVLELDTAYIRDGLQRWSGRQLAGPSSEVSAVTTAAASARSVPVAGRSPARQRPRGARRQGFGSFGDSMRAREATVPRVSPALAQERHALRG